MGLRPEHESTAAWNSRPRRVTRIRASQIRRPAAERRSSARARCRRRSTGRGTTPSVSWFRSSWLGWCVTKATVRRRRGNAGWRSRCQPRRPRASPPRVGREPSREPRGSVRCARALPDQCSTQRASASFGWTRAFLTTPRAPYAVVGGGGRRARRSWTRSRRRAAARGRGLALRGRRWGRRRACCPPRRRRRRGASGRSFGAWETAAHRVGGGLVSLRRVGGRRRSASWFGRRTARSTFGGNRARRNRRSKMSALPSAARAQRHSRSRGSRGARRAASSCAPRRAVARGTPSAARWFGVSKNARSGRVASKGVPSKGPSDRAMVAAMRSSAARFSRAAASGIVG